MRQNKHTSARNVRVQKAIHADQWFTPHFVFLFTMSWAQLAVLINTHTHIRAGPHLQDPGLAFPGVNGGVAP